MNVQFKKTSKGEVAIMPRKEYEALNEAFEDAGTARISDRARKEIAAGAPAVPHDRCRAHQQRRQRRARRARVEEHHTDAARSQEQLGQGYISDLESGRRKGTTAAMKRIAAALGVPLDLLV